MADSEPTSFQARLQSLFNGPPLAGIGATADKGLLPAKYHILPYEVLAKDRVKMTLSDSVAAGGAKWVASARELAKFTDIEIDTLIRYAKYNVDSVYNISQELRDVANVDTKISADVRNDMLSVYILMAGANLYYGECRSAKDAELTQIKAIEVSADDRTVLISVEQMNRAATIIMARAHTKYCTNHAVGGSPAQGAMASTIRWLYSITALRSSNVTTNTKAERCTSAIYWSTHPMNEPAIIPFVVNNSKIIAAEFFATGPRPLIPAAEEFFRIRKNAVPASAHNFALGLSAIKMLEPIGIMQFFPDQSRFDLLKSGVLLIDAHGAALHPAANYWGLERISANQSAILPLIQDLGYPIWKLFPASSLASAPAFQKNDVVNSKWRAFIDSLKAKMDESAEKMMDAETFEKIRVKVTPQAEESESLLAVMALSSGVKKAELKSGKRYALIDDIDASGFKVEEDKGEDTYVPKETADTHPGVINNKEFTHSEATWWASTAVVDARGHPISGKYYCDEEANIRDLPMFRGDEAFSKIIHYAARESIDEKKDSEGKVIVEGVESRDEQWCTSTFAFFTNYIAEEDADSIRLKNDVILRVSPDDDLVDRVGNIYREIRLT